MYHCVIYLSVRDCPLPKGDFSTSLFPGRVDSNCPGGGTSCRCGEKRSPPSRVQRFSQHVRELGGHVIHALIQLPGR